MSADPHPANTLQWLCEVENHRQVCAHCRQPWPCDEGIRRHQQSDWHRWQCEPIGHCYYANRSAA